MPPKKQKNGSKSVSFSSLNSRIESFEGTKLAKSSQFIEWPYKKPTIELMAKCGFYFTPTKKFTDRITCFYCNGKQTNWKDITNPASYHLDSHHDCLFSRLENYKLQSSNDPNFDWESTDVFNNPFSEIVISLRKESFNLGWRFDELEGAIPTSDKMVAAGFTYCPQDRGDDLAICQYCNISLEGWELTDDPLNEHQKRATTKCYFLKKLKVQSSTNRSKRVSDINQEPNDNKKIKFSNLSQVSDSSFLLQSPRNLRMRKDRSRNMSSYKEASSTENEKSDESFDLTSHSIESSSEHNQKAKSKVLLVSPKKQILDSSFDSSDLFSKKYINNRNIEQLISPPLKKDSVEPPSSKNSQMITSDIPAKATLQNITNISSHLASKTHNKEDLNSSQNIGSQNADEIDDSDMALDSLKVYETEEVNVVSEKERNKTKTHHENQDNYEDIILVSQSLDSTRILHSPQIEQQNSLASIGKNSVYIAQAEPPNAEPDDRPKSSKFNNSLVVASTKDVLESSASINMTQSVSKEKQGSSKSINKSISVLPRFGPSEIQRSRSPFLDDDYQGSDTIEKGSIVGSNDIPLEESTDHNIKLPVDDSTSKSLKVIGSFQKSTSSLKDLESTSDGTFHSLDKFTPSSSNLIKQTWLPTDTSSLFQKLEDLQITKNYLSELNDLPYELSDDIDGRVSYFINEMPAEELNMTIDQWVKHTASQGRKHLEMMCNVMIDQFDAECDRALTKLQTLLTD